MRPSFRFKIAALSALISGGVLLGFITSCWYLLFKQKTHQLDTEIRAVGNRHPGWLANPANLDRFEGSLQYIFGDEHKGEMILLVRDSHGKPLYVSPEWPQSVAPESLDWQLQDDRAAAANVSEAGGGRGRGGMGRGLGGGRGGGGPVIFTKQPKFFTLEAPEGAWRVGIMGNDDLRLAIGLSYASVQSELNVLRNAFLVIIPLALLAIAAGGWWVAGRALKPLKTITATAEQVTARGLDQRIPPSSEDPAIGRLIQVLNRMMDRLESSFHQATRFSADASHELKTPLTVMQAELENAIQNSGAGSREQRVFSSLLEETQHLKRITASLLLLSQADLGQLKLILGEVPLSEDLESIVEDAQILAADSNIQFTLKIQSGVTIRGDRALLRTALMNLVKNAVIYNEQGGRIGVSLSCGTDVEVSVWNTGPGILEQEQQRIFERFYRGQRGFGDPSEGLGLGLSLAREIIIAHQGALLLKESRPGHTCFIAHLKSQLQA